MREDYRSTVTGHPLILRTKLSANGQLGAVGAQPCLTPAFRLGWSAPHGAVPCKGTTAKKRPPARPVSIGDRLPLDRAFPGTTSCIEVNFPYSNLFITTCGCSIVVMLRPSKPTMWVRFPSPAPTQALDWQSVKRFFASCRKSAIFCRFSVF